MAVLYAAMIVAATSIVAGGYIRVWAFLVFSVFVTIGFASLNVGRDVALWETIGTSAALLGLMEISYAAGVFAWGIWRRARRLRKVQPLSKPAHTPSEWK